ncbi:MAG TPA: DUF11 domain-containing protein [Longimicrobium sp.]|jgi:uncharacterized repeat protein (TIGR01451 family)
MSARLRAILLTVAFALLACAPRAWAAPGVTVTMISSPALTLDSNKPCQEGPQAAYVAFRVTNTSGAALNNVRATISGFANAIALGGGQPALQYVGYMAAGAQKTLYWFTEYDCGTVGASANLVVSVTDNTAGATTGSGTVTTRSMVSAMAGGVLSSGTMGAGAVVGQVIEFDVAYEFGGVSAGDSHNLQVAGNKTFRADCFQLVKMRVITSSVGGANPGQEDLPYFFAPANAGGSKIPITVRYFFKYKCEDVVSRARPYGNQFSGGQLKYSSNYETFVGPPFPGATDPFVVTKSVTPEKMAAGGPVTYAVTVTNPSDWASEMDSIVDVLPAGVTFNGISLPSGVTTGPGGNSALYPSSGAMGTLIFRGSPGQSYTIPARGSLVLRYTATVTGSGVFTNTASAYTAATQLGSYASATVIVGTANLSVAKTGPTAAVASDTLRYVLTVKNEGTDTAYNVVMSDTLPVGVTFVSATGGVTPVGRVITWAAVPKMASGATQQQTVVVLAPASLGTLVNVAAATSGTFDNVPGNNNGSAPESRVATSVGSPVVVTPDGLATPTPRLHNGRYGQPFTVTNASPASGSYGLSLRTTAMSAAGVFMTVDSVTGPGITTPASYAAAPVPLAGRTSYVYTVWYRVAEGDTAVNTQFLRAQAVSDTLLRDDGFAEVRRVQPKLTLTKSVSPTGIVASGTDLTYTLNLSNVGEYAARSVVVTDTVPLQVALKVDGVSQVLPAGVTATVTYHDALGAPIDPGTVPGCVSPAGYDTCVRRIVWTLSGDLPATAAASAGSFTFVARIR